MKYLDVPKYKIQPRPERFLFNRLLISICIGILLYVIIYSNYYLLNKSVPASINWLLSVGIVLLIIIELISIYLVYGNYSYEFFEQKIIINSGTTRSIPYDELRHIHYAANFVDKWFKTGSVVLELTDGKKVKLKYLDNPNQAYTLMQKYVK